MDRFQELKCIGRGSYGSAHLVVEKADEHQRYVVKKIPMELLSAKEKDQSFAEVDLLAKLKHPNVVEYKENFVVDNVLHIVMAYCDGGDLAGKIKEQQKIREEALGKEKDPADPSGFFPISQVLDWFVQMAMAIKYLHSQRVLHRDLKTSNVFLTTENVVKLGDFGIAKTLDSTLDQAKTVVGTPYYMSPEVCESKPYSYASDVWSLGCVFYEMLALRHAFDAPNILTLILKIVQQDFAPVPPHYDKEVSELLRKLLDKDPERRPSMEEIFATPYIRHHMEGLVASGGSFKVKILNPVARRPHGPASANGRRRLHPKNGSARRSSGEKRKMRLSSASSQSPTGDRPFARQDSRVAPIQWLPVQTPSGDNDDADVRNELELLDASILEETQLHFRPPERSTTPEPLVCAEDKPHPLPQLYGKGEIEEELFGSVVSPIRPKARRASQHGHPVAWVNSGENADEGNHSSSYEIKDDDPDARFYSEAVEMSPNFQNEYSEECIDSLQIDYGSKQPESISTDRNLDQFRQRGHTTPTEGRSRFLHDGNGVELSTLSLDDDGSEGTDTPSLSESCMMREHELDADSADSDASADTSQSEYEAEENFYSDGSSDYFDRSGTQYSEDFDDSDADIIDYADDGFATADNEQEDDQTKPTRWLDEDSVTDLDGSMSPLLRSRKLEAPTEVQWVMKNVAQSLMLTRDDLHPRQAA